MRKKGSKGDSSQMEFEINEGEGKKEKTEGIGNEGKPIIDAMVAPQDIKYPTHLDLLNKGREITEKIIDKLYEPEAGKRKPRSYQKKAWEAYLSVAKRRRKSGKVLVKGLPKQLNYVKRNLKTIDKLRRENSGKASGNMVLTW